MPASRLLCGCLASGRVTPETAGQPTAGFLPWSVVGQLLWLLLSSLPPTMQTTRSWKRHESLEWAAFVGQDVEWDECPCWGGRSWSSANHSMFGLLKERRQRWEVLQLLSELHDQHSAGRLISLDTERPQQWKESCLDRLLFWRKRWRWNFYFADFICRLLAFLRSSEGRHKRLVKATHTCSYSGFSFLCSAKTFCTLKQKQHL